MISTKDSSDNIRIFFFFALFIATTTPKIFSSFASFLSFLYPWINSNNISIVLVLKLSGALCVGYSSERRKHQIAEWVFSRYSVYSVCAAFTKTPKGNCNQSLLAKSRSGGSCDGKYLKAHKKFANLFDVHFYGHIFLTRRMLHSKC